MFEKNRDFDFAKPKRSRKYKMNSVQCHKVVCRIDTGTIDRLTLIKDSYGFKSNYELIQYIAACFLRVADPECVETDINEVEGIETMFDEYSHGEKHFQYVKPKRAMNNSSLNRF